MPEIAKVLTMNTKDIEKILDYCQQATDGPWGRNLDAPKLITSKLQTDSKDATDVCHLASGHHKTDWKNYHFIVNARRDLPILANYCLHLKQTLEKTIKQFEPKRARSRWTQLKKSNLQLQLKKANQRLQSEMTKRRQELTEAKELFKYEKAEHLRQYEETKKLLEGERLQNQQYVEDVNAKLDEQTQTAQAQQEMARKRLDFLKKHPESTGTYSDILLDELSMLETSFYSSPRTAATNQNSPDNLARTASEFADSDEQTIAPTMSNEEMLGELDRLDDTISSISETSRQISNATDRISGITAQTAANEFADSQQTQPNDTDAVKS